MRYCLLVLLCACGDSPDGKKKAGDTAVAPMSTTVDLGTPFEPEPDADGDGSPDALDCAPEDPSVFPGAVERCNGVDDDCSGEADEIFDLDEDGFLADEAECRALGVPVDCDDLDPTVHPSATEVCDGRDEDCSGIADDALDADDDGFGACDDCDDDDPFVYPGAADVCDGVDNDCSGGVDEPWDSDGDGRSPCDGDCDDSDPYNAGHLSEVCDGRDNDCDGEVDEGFDADGDGYFSCLGDCDDDDPAIHPGLIEICDGRDTNCDGEVPDDLDLDGDGFTICEGDCNDLRAETRPGAPEDCDTRDDDCSGFEDDLPECMDCIVDGPYWFCNDTEGWTAARLACEGVGAQLVVIDTPEETAVLIDTLLPGFEGMWIGLSDRVEEGLFEWVDGTPLGEADWGPGQPADITGDEDCVALIEETGLWRPVSCGLANPFICEFI